MNRRYFGASDAPMKDEQLAAAKGGKILHLPMTMGAVVPTYNVPELSEGKKVLRFTSDTLSGDLSRRYRKMERSQARRGQSRARQDRQVHRRRAPFRWFGDLEHLDELPLRGERQVGQVRLVPAPRSSGPSGSAERATRASRATSSRPSTPSATSRKRTPCRTSFPWLR